MWKLLVKLFETVYLQLFLFALAATSFIDTPLYNHFLYARVTYQVVVKQSTHLTQKVKGEKAPFSFSKKIRSGKGLSAGNWVEDIKKASKCWTLNNLEAFWLSLFNGPAIFKNEEF